MIATLFHGGWAPSRAVAPLLLSSLLLMTVWMPRAATSAPDDRFASTERSRYSALCRARKDLDSCSDAVRWNPGDPALIAALADALVRAGRLPDALRDYRRAASLDPAIRGLDAKIKAAEARLTERNRPRKAPVERATADAATAKRYTNVDSEAQSH